ncbi:MAG TPA: glycerol-3-phosphate dehydrogenase/oxidase [Solimonas sp.]|nr:glycerol-3-phosphate dehydrogenase/oxidase [Solimonas sp.]
MSARADLRNLNDRYDLIVVGGGITGAGVFREAVRRGVRALLVDAADFASGTSSASSKLVHGGLRYLKNGQWRLTMESVRERERLLREAAGLVEPLPFLMPIRAGRKPGRWLMQIGLRVYDAMAGTRRSFWLDAKRAVAREPVLQSDDLRGAMLYEDATTDDARLVLRLLFAGVGDGGTVLNYVAADIGRDDARVRGVRLRDADSGATREIAATLVINATGAWADRLSAAPSGAPPLRPLRGSHLVFAARSLPLSHAVTWLHPHDGRPVFAYPWQGAIVYGTTDLDHDGELASPAITVAETGYLMTGLRAQFPNLSLRAGDALSSYAGVRPVVAGGHDDPSRESRESAMWTSPGLIGITGGKLTTFRVTARQVLDAAAAELPQLATASDGALFDVAAHDRLGGRYGAAATDIRAMPAALQTPLAGTPYGLAELIWSLRHEAVVHLDDLLLRRTRIGLVSANGGAALLPMLAEHCRAELGWDEMRWQQECERYRALWQARHAPPAA